MQTPPSFLSGTSNPITKPRQCEEHPHVPAALFSPPPGTVPACQGVDRPLQVRPSCGPEPPTPTSQQPGKVLGKHLAHPPHGGFRASPRWPEIWLLSQGCPLCRPASLTGRLLVLGLAHPEPADKCPCCVQGGWPQPWRPCRAQVSQKSGPWLCFLAEAPQVQYTVSSWGSGKTQRTLATPARHHCPPTPEGWCPAAVSPKAGQDLGAAVSRRDMGKRWLPLLAASTHETYPLRLSIRGVRGVQPWPEEGGDLALGPP